MIPTKVFFTELFSVAFLFELAEISACCGLHLIGTTITCFFNKQSQFGECSSGLCAFILFRAPGHVHDDLLAAVGHPGHELDERLVRHVDRLAAIHRPVREFNQFVDS